MVLPFTPAHAVAAVGGWSVSAALPLIATLAARWGLPLALVSGVPVGVIVAAVVAHNGSVAWPELAELLYNVVPLLIWPIASFIFVRVLGAQRRDSAALQDTQAMADLRRQGDVRVLDDLPQRLLERVGPALDELAAGNPMTSELRARCRVLERQVRLQIATRRLLNDADRELLERLLAAGWQFSITDEAPLQLDDVDIHTAQRLCRTLLDLCARYETGSVTVRLTGIGARLLTVVVSGPAAAEAAVSLAADADVEVLDDELLAQVFTADSGLLRAATGSDPGRLAGSYPSLSAHDDGAYDDGTYEDGAYEDEAFDDGAYDGGTHRDGTHRAGARQGTQDWAPGEMPHIDTAPAMPRMRGEIG